MTAYTSSQTGDWSNPATWGGSGVPGDGDTASIGAHTVTVDVNTTVGTSPNDATTKVVDKTSGTGALVIAAGVKLTIKGNLGGVNAAQVTLNAGAGIEFDASDSGGTPVYTWVNGGGWKLTCNGTAESRCFIRSVAGRYWAFSGAMAFNTVDYVDFARASTFAVTNAALNSTTGTIIRHCTFDDCGTINISQASASLDWTFQDNRITNSQHASESLKVALGTTATSGTRVIQRCSADKSFNNLCKNLIFDNNVFGGISCAASGSATFARAPRNNLLDNALNLNSGNGMRLIGSWSGLYVVMDNGVGNPHYLAPYCLESRDETYQRVIFENQSPDLTDTGDCFLPQGAFCTSGYKLIVKNCIAGASPRHGVQAGQMLTSYNPPATDATHKVEFYRSTANQNQTSVGGVGLRAAFSVAEAATGAAGQVAALKSNLVYADATGNGHLAERISGTVDGIITASGADYNWLYNIDAGDNGRGYEDRANSPGQDLWDTGNADGGDAAAAGVDDNQGSGNPNFVDDTRCIASWCADRGYGEETYAAGMTALRADPTRVADLINYVFEGYKVQNAAMRNAAHDGGVVGAANYHATRNLAPVTALGTLLGLAA